MIPSGQKHRSVEDKKIQKAIILIFLDIKNTQPDTGFLDEAQEPSKHYLNPLIAL